jgi:hypothetical protein
MLSIVQHTQMPCFPAGTRNKAAVWRKEKCVDRPQAAIVG